MSACEIPKYSDAESVIKHLFSDQKLAHYFTNVKNSNRSSLNEDVKAMKSTYWPVNEKERVATELERHGGMRYSAGSWSNAHSSYQNYAAPPSSSSSLKLNRKLSHTLAALPCRSLFAPSAASCAMGMYSSGTFDTT